MIRGMAIKFEYNLEGDIAAKLARIRQAAARKMVFFQGDLKKGKFDGGISLLGVDMTVKGSYRIEGRKIIVTMSKKPSSMTWTQVDSMLRGFVEG